MIWTLILILLIAWLLGIGPLALGSLVHLILLLVVVLLFFQFVSYSRRGGPPPGDLP